MSAKLLFRLHFCVRRIEESLSSFYGRGFPFEPICVHTSAISAPTSNTSTTKPFSLKDLIGDGILWAVPKHRRSVERRLKRKFGLPEFHQCQPKTTLRVCPKCGGDYDVGRLCNTCYKKVRDETKLIQDKIVNELGLNPVDEEIVVLYDGEKGNESPEFWKDKRIVEMEKTRPVWFSKNLMQKSTQKPATTKDIKPSDLA